MTNNIFTVLSEEYLQGIRVKIYNPQKYKLVDDEYLYNYSQLDGLKELCETQKLHTLQQVVEWGDKPCRGKNHWGTIYSPPKKKHQCINCWQELMALVAKG